MVRPDQEITQIISNVYNISNKNYDTLLQVMERAAEEGNAHVIGTPEQYSWECSRGEGLTSLVWLAESHILLTIKKKGFLINGVPISDDYAELEVYMCGKANPFLTNSMIIDELKPTDYKSKKLTHIVGEEGPISKTFLEEDFGTDYTPQLIVDFYNCKADLNDLNGLKIRALAGPTTASIKALGAAPVTVTAPDLYSSLERGVLDGLVWAWAGVDSYKVYEILHYWTDQPIISGTTAMIMNLNKWNSLPADIQKAIMSVSGKYGARFSGQTAWGPSEVENVLQKAKKGNFDFTKVELKPGEQDKFVKAAKPIWEKWKSDNKAKGRPVDKIMNLLFQIQEKYRIK